MTSSFFAGSVGANPVIIYTVFGKLKEAWIVSVSQGKSVIALDHPLAAVQQAMEGEMKSIILDDVAADAGKAMDLVHAGTVESQKKQPPGKVSPAAAVMSVIQFRNCFMDRSTI